MRLVILCEGDTEKRVLKQFLQPYTAGFTRVDILKTTGNAKLKAEFHTLAETELEDDPEAIVFCLTDLLQAPFSFPQYVEDDANPFSPVTLTSGVIWKRRFLQDCVIAFMLSQWLWSWKLGFWPILRR